MNKRQKKLFSNLIKVIVFTILMIFGLITFKESVNKTEATRAMQIISNNVMAYKQKTLSLPSEDYIDELIKNISAVRIGDIHYRAQWIGYGANKKNTILAYSNKKYSFFAKGGYLVLWLDGTVEWLSPKDFEPILLKQQQQIELDWLIEHIK